WGVQFDLAEIEGEILSLNLTYSAVEHAQVYAMQLDQSTQAYLENAFPQSVVWSGSGNWSNSANWNDGTVPASGRDVTFTGTGNTLLDSTRTVGMVKLETADGYTLSSTNG